MLYTWMIIYIYIYIYILENCIIICLIFVNLQCMQPNILFLSVTFFALYAYFPDFIYGQVVKKVKVRVGTLEDVLALKFINFIVGANQLLFEGLTRELPL